MEDLRKKSFSGIIWSYVNKFGTQVITIVPAMILARLIPPSEYGLLAMTAVFTGVAYQLADGGFGNALVQKKDADHLDFCSVFYFNIGICGFVYAIFWFIAPLIAQFFDELRLINIVRISTLSLIFGAVGQIHGIIFKKEIEYRKPAIRNIFVQLFSAIIAVVLAFAGYGVWALVVQGLSQTLLNSIVNWMISTWRPTLCFSFIRLRSLFGFGSKLMVESIISYLFGKGYDIVIGKFYSPASLAYYNRGSSTADLFSGTFFGVFSGVTFPVFVKMQDDNERLLFNIRRFMSVTTLVLFSVMLTVLVLGEPLFRMMYSSKWDASIPLFQLICISTLTLPLISICESILWAKGESGKYLFISILRKVFVVVTILLTWHMGIEYMIAGQILCKVLELVVLTYCTNYIIGYGFFDVINDIWKNIVVAICVVLPVFLFDSFVSSLCIEFLCSELFCSFLRLICGGMIAVTAFLVINKFWGFGSYRELIQFLSDAIGEKKILKWLSPKDMR